MFELGLVGSARPGQAHMCRLETVFALGASCGFEKKKQK
jgi:hypothetical protein